MNLVCTKEGFSDPPSVSSISRLLRGGRPGDDGKKDYTINGILGGGKSEFLFFCNFIRERMGGRGKKGKRDTFLRQRFKFSHSQSESCISLTFARCLSRREHSARARARTKAGAVKFSPRTVEGLITLLGCQRSERAKSASRSG